MYSIKYTHFAVGVYLAIIACSMKSVSSEKIASSGVVAPLAGGVILGAIATLGMIALLR